MPRVTRLSARLRARLIATGALAVAAVLATAAPASAAPAQFNNQVNWTLNCDGGTTIEVRSQSSNGLQWVTNDGRTLLTVAGEIKFAAGDPYEWWFGPQKLAQTGLDRRLFTCTTELERSAGGTAFVRVHAMYMN